MSTPLSHYLTLTPTRAQNAEADELIQKQFDLLQSLLTDEVPCVRAAAAAAVSQALCSFWEAIPASTSKVQHHYVTPQTLELSDTTHHESLRT